MLTLHTQREQFCNKFIFRKCMIEDEIRYAVATAMGVPPTAEQAAAMDVFARFAADGRERVVMVLRGAAGTGKTTLAAAVVKALCTLRQKLVLMAPTGRAAKVFSLYAGHAAYTIHRRIYRQRTAGDLSAFNLNANLGSSTLFVVDEASMIANQGSTESAFGSGRLLDDLIEFVYNGAGCRLVLIGDRAQLPPVGETESPALTTSVLRQYGLTVYESDLTEVVRQAADSGILWNATAVRSLLSASQLVLPRLRVAGFADVRLVKGDELIESLAGSYSRVGIDETMVITRSNKRANIYNEGIRRTILGCEDQICRGDRLMIVKNNYYWTQQAAADSTADATPGGTPAHRGDDKFSFIANGDIAVVQRVSRVRQLYGFSFADVTMEFPDYDQQELAAATLLTTLTTEAPALTREQQSQLFEAVSADYADEPGGKAGRMKRLKQDAHYNALQVKFAYAVTCHKAQGGQWEHVYLDQGYMTDDMLTPDYVHWLYTAFTRATRCLFLVNWPSTMVED